MSKARSFGDMHLKYEDLFDVTSILGIYIQSSKPISKKTNFNLNVGFHPTELVTLQKGNMTQMALLHQLRTFTLVTSTKFSHFNINSLFSSRYQSATFKTTPTENVVFNLKLEKRPSISIRPTFSAQFSFPKMVILTQYQIPDYNNLSIFDLNISLFDKFGFQLVKKIKDYGSQYGFAFLSCFNFLKASVAISLVHDIDSYFILRSTTKVHENARAGVKLRVNQHLSSALTLGYKLKINSFLIHSTIDTDGVVKSYFDNEVSDQFHFIMSTSLNHPAKSYHFGIGLSWMKEETD